MLNNHNCDIEKQKPNMKKLDIKESRTSNITFKNFDFHVFEDHNYVEIVDAEISGQFSHNN